MLLTVMAPGTPPMAYEVEGDRVVIGRALTASLVVHDPSLSRLHAEIRREGERWVLSDLGSRNGTRLNGRDIVAPKPLEIGDRILLGQTVLMFEAKVPGALAADDDIPPTTGSHRVAQRHAGDGASRDQQGPFLAGRSLAIRELLAAVDRVAPATASVLLEGESGTGKELVARLVHHRGPRRLAPFVVVNCPAVTGSLFEAELFGVEKGTATGVEPRAGRIEIAHGGTLFLDEVGDLDTAAQAKLLRFLQDRTIDRVGGRSPVRLDIRIVAATNQDLAAAMESGRFRRDLFHRLDVVRLRIPPLRERPEDVPPLVDHFLAEGADGTRMSPEALDVLTRHPWPGNVRELEHAIARARLFASGGWIRPEDLPPGILATPGAETEDDRLWRRIVADGECFWEVVRGPYLRRELAPRAVRALIARAHREAGPTCRDVARLFRIEAEQKRLMDFLGRHGLRARSRLARGEGST